MVSIYISVLPLLDEAEVLEGVLLPARILLLKVKALIDTAVVVGLHLHEVSLLVVDLLLLVALPHEIRMLM